MFTRSEFVAAGQPAPRFRISQNRPFPQCVPPTTVEIYHLRNHGYSNYKRVVREIRTLRAMWRGLETTHGSDTEALSTETESKQSRPNLRSIGASPRPYRSRESDGNRLSACNSNQMHV